MSTSLSHVFGGNFFTRYIARNIADVLPRRHKRLLYVSSAMGMLLKTKVLDPRLAESINAKMRLAFGASSLFFPVYIGSIIWKSLRDKVVMLSIGAPRLCELDVCGLCDRDCWKTALFFAQNAPNWMRYGSIGLMTADIHDMLKELDRQRSGRSEPPAEETKAA